MGEEIGLTKDEKRRLSMNINSLTSSQLAVVVRIIKEKLPNIANDQEITLDIDSLDTGTLRSLQNYVQSTKRRKPKRKPPQTKKTPDISAQAQTQAQPISASSQLSASQGSVPSKASPTVPQPTLSASTGQITELARPAEIKANSSGSEESESESEESESESESESDNDDNPLPDTSKNTVETVAAPILSSSTPALIQGNDDSSSVAKIISAPSTSVVNVDKIGNLASWNSLTSEQSEPTSNVTHSADVTNLWSSFKDSHAQVQQKILEKQKREEQLKKEKEEEEQRLREQEIEQKRLKEEEEKRQKILAEEAKAQAERDLEEARLKAKRDREKKVLEDEEVSGDMLSLNSFDLSGPGMM